VFDALVSYEARVSTQLGAIVRNFRHDNGGEYTDRRVRDFLSLKGIHDQVTTPDTPQLNSVPERKWSMLFRKVRAMLAHSGLIPVFWGSALNAALHIGNRVLRAASGDVTPHHVNRSLREIGSISNKIS
jgi:transposase InsO family protein